MSPRPKAAYRSFTTCFAFFAFLSAHGGFLYMIWPDALGDCTGHLLSVSLCDAQKLSGLLDARHGQFRRIQKAYLHEQ